MSVTPDWTVTHTQTGNAGTFTITAPATFTLDNEAGKAVLFISDGAERTVMRTIALVRIDYLVADESPVVAGTTGGAFPVLLASNASWTAAVSAEGDGWCTVTPAAGTGYGTLTITVAESTLEAPDRSATVTITSGTLTQTVAVTQMLIPVPTYAASAQVWTIGVGIDRQIWSDYINDTDRCNKEAFNGGNIYGSNPDCRNNIAPYRGYYYTWPYVSAHADTLCPSPWRVPDRSDFAKLYRNLGGEGTSCTGCPGLADAFINEWGGERAGWRIPENNATYQAGSTLMISSIEAVDGTTINGTTCYVLRVDVSDCNPNAEYYTRDGLNVRCVR
jgi:uncharacterized protein (TIGR02145 family)